jgi:hypothetical protein
MACACVPAAAVAAPHVRTGFCAGVGFGVESLSWTDIDGDRDTEGSGVTNARVGWAFQNDLVGGVEFWGWAKEYEFLAGGQDVPVDVQIAALTLCATYWPENTGFFVRVGAGMSYGRIEISAPSSVTGVTSGQETETGFAVNLAPGYEFRLTERFALGAQGDVVYLGLGGPLEDVFGYGINAQFNWYW